MSTFNGLVGNGMERASASEIQSVFHRKRNAEWKQCTWKNHIGTSSSMRFALCMCGWYVYRDGWHTFIRASMMKQPWARKFNKQLDKIASQPINNAFDTIRTFILIFFFLRASEGLRSGWALHFERCVKYLWHFFKNKILRIWGIRRRRVEMLKPTEVI